MINAQVFSVFKEQIEAFIKQGDLTPEKLMTDQSDANRKDVYYKFHVEECTYFIRIYQIEDDAEQSTYVTAEMGLGIIKSELDTHIYRYLLDWNRREPSPLKLGVDDQRICIFSYRQRLNLLDPEEFSAYLGRMITHGEKIHENLIGLGALTLQEGWNLDNQEANILRVN